MREGNERLLVSRGAIDKPAKTGCQGPARRGMLPLCATKLQQIRTCVRIRMLESKYGPGTASAASGGGQGNKGALASRIAVLSRSRGTKTARCRFV